MKAGAWKVEGELGKGGMAQVYAVVHQGFGKRAALKLAHKAILGDQFTPDTFLREARIVHLVNHPCVTDVFATGTYDGRPYLVMERLEGQTLGARVDAGPLDRCEAIWILRELCDVLGAAHEAGVIHRDLKLDNIFLLDTPCSGGHRLKLLDWGVATILGERDPLEGMIAGTLTYVAPEQVRADDLTPAADIYSLGVLAYQLLLGAPPFASTNDLELIKQHVRATPPRPSATWADIPPELEGLLLAMLAKRPEDRPSLAMIDAVLARAAALLSPPVPSDTATSWLALHARPPLDVLGRAAVVVPAATQRVLAAVLAFGVAAATLASVL